MKNDQQRAGELAGDKAIFGPRDRYAVAPVFTRFKAVEWFVWDAERPDPSRADLPSVIRQAASKCRAMKGLV